MNPLLRKWLDEKNLEFNHDGYSQETLNALKEFANYVATQKSAHTDPPAACPSCGLPPVQFHKNNCSLANTARG